MDNEFKPYELAGDTLLALLGYSHPQYREALANVKSLKKNVEETLLFGDSTASRSRRAEIVMRLDELTRDELGKSFNELIKSDQVNTGGGAYIGGNVSVKGGNFIGRDHISIIGDGNVIGDSNTVSVIQSKYDKLEVSQRFQALYDAIEALTDIPLDDKSDLVFELKNLEREMLKGEKVDEGVIARQFRRIKRIAPSIYEKLAIEEIEKDYQTWGLG